MRLSWRRLVPFMAGEPPSGGDELSKALKRHRDELIRGERKASARMRKAYARAYLKINAQAVALMKDIRKVQAAGLQVEPDQLFRSERYALLMGEIEAQMARFARTTQSVTRSGQSRGIGTGLKHSAELTGIEVAAARKNGTMPPGFVKAITRLPREAFEAMVGYLSDGSPLESIFEPFGRVAARGASNALTTGVALGENPKKIARRLKVSLDGDARRAETIARTETIRAHRTAAIANYQANSDVLEGWRWSSSRDGRTCPICLGLDGKLFAFNEQMGSHPRCRCTPLPANKYREYTRGTGDEWLRSQPEDVARKMLGPTRFKLWQDGLRLDQMVFQGQHPRWGAYAKLVPLREATRIPIALPPLPDPTPQADPFKGAASRSLDLQIKQKALKKAIEETVADLDGLHGPGEMEGLERVLYDEKARAGMRYQGKAPGPLPVVAGAGGSEGVFMSVPRLGPVKIGIKPRTEKPRFVFAHEFGHFVDGYATSEKLTESNLPEILALRDVFKASKGAKLILEAYKGGLLGRQHFTYLTSLTEVWARAYSQWAANKAGGKLLEELREVQKTWLMNGHWDDDDFVPIGAAVEAVLRKIGVIE